MPKGDHLRRFFTENLGINIFNSGNKPVVKQIVKNMTDLYSLYKFHQTKYIMLIRWH